MEIGYVYVLVIDNKPIYVGQSVSPKKRFNQHKSNHKRNVDKYLYNNIKDFSKVEMKILKVCPKYELDYYEMFYIKKCIDKKIPILNDCVKAQTYCVSKYKMTIQEYNTKLFIKINI